MALFNITKHIKYLTETGMPEREAQAVVTTLAEIVENHLASKEDLKNLEVRLDNKIFLLQQDVKSLEIKINAVESVLTSKINAVESVLTSKITAVDNKLSWLITLIGTTGTFFAVLNLIHMYGHF